MTTAARASAPPDPCAVLAARRAVLYRAAVSRRAALGRGIQGAQSRSQGQTLTALGSYWKGRKPLILVRAVVLGCLLPATDNAAADLDIFLKLMAMDDAAFGRRFDGSAAEFRTGVSRLCRAGNGGARPAPDLARRSQRERAADARRGGALRACPYAERVKIVRRPEECDEAELLAPVWGDVNGHLGTNARSLARACRTIGRRAVRPSAEGRGHVLRRRVDPLRGGAHRLRRLRVRPQSHRLHADLGGLQHHRRDRRRSGPRSRQRRSEVAAAVDAEITRLGIEHDAEGNRAKAYLYCLETRCPKTGWMVPMAPSWVISKTRNVVAKLVPDPARQTLRH